MKPKIKPGLNKKPAAEEWRLAAEARKAEPSTEKKESWAWNWKTTDWTWNRKAKARDRRKLAQSQSGGQI